MDFAIVLPKVLMLGEFIIAELQEHLGGNLAVHQQGLHGQVLPWYNGVKHMWRLGVLRKR